ncbi:glutamine--fructose-6-phosphate transaminase (isomerizing) [Gammaproteobacteria bacterium]|nr:glutamine--fructose-6-phosphate transaminase (isomerizing) [Gammaproteobacteria bacterium]
MCGIVAASGKRNVIPILMDGLQRLEYRGYDSAGIAVLENNTITRIRKQGKVGELYKEIEKNKTLTSKNGIAHTRWATHGEPSTINAHPHTSGDEFSNDEIALVHNGIIENFDTIRQQMTEKGYVFTSKTDSETIVHLIHHFRKKANLLEAIALASKELEGDFAIAIIDPKHPEKIFGTKQGNPLVIGQGLEENYFASDAGALIALTSRFVLLEDGDIAEISPSKIAIYNQDLEQVTRETTVSNLTADSYTKDGYRHYMEKEIFEQPEVVKRAYGSFITGEMESALKSSEVNFKNVQHVQISACGTSYYSALVGKAWLEHYTGIPVTVDIGSEYRYNTTPKKYNSVFISISQSGETADTLAALRKAKKENYLGTVALCNVTESALAREADVCIPTNAGPEIGVASTKAFVSQLVTLALFGVLVGDQIGLDSKQQKISLKSIKELPEIIEHVLGMAGEIEEMAWELNGKTNALYLGRGLHYPIALEGALKMKEISYIHAEAYPAGELKHGPLALVDENMPVIAIAPSGELLKKIMSNLEEVRARGGKLYVICDDENITKNGFEKALILPSNLSKIQSPIVYTIPLQLLAYYAALHKGNDVDQPRNLAKAVTVE